MKNNRQGLKISDFVKSKPKKRGGWQKRVAKKGQRKL